MLRYRSAYFAIAALLALVGAPGNAQQPPANRPLPGGPGTEVKRPPGPPASPSIGTKPAVDAKSPSASLQGEIVLQAFLTDEGQRIDQGLVWRLFQEDGPVRAGQEPKLKLIQTWRETSPTVRAAPGDYIVNASFGRAHVTRKIKIAQGGPTVERIVLNAGGLRVIAMLGGSSQAADMAVSYDIYAGEADQSNNRVKVMGGARPGGIIRLNAGIYHLVSAWGDANAIVSADVTVEAGKLTEATVNHLGAKVTLKLVTRSGGEALADTQWSLHTAQGEPVRDSVGALPSHILSAGSYVAIARHSGREFRHEFTVASGQPQQVEVVMP